MFRYENILIQSGVSQDVTTGGGDMTVYFNAEFKLNTLPVVVCTPRYINNPNLVLTISDISSKYFKVYIKDSSGNVISNSTQRVFWIAIGFIN